jgi:hypothetical protein
MHSVATAMRLEAAATKQTRYQNLILRVAATLENEADRNCDL